MPETDFRLITQESPRFICGECQWKGYCKSDGIKKAVGRAPKSLTTPEIKTKSQKEVVAECLENAIAKASGNGEYRFSLRQLYYAVRPYVIRETGKEPDYTYFCRDLIGSYEAEHGDIPLMYRDERGTLYHQVETVQKSGSKKGVASYINPQWERWLQNYRVELNAMSTPQFLAWLEGKIQLHDKGKVIPPEGIMQES